MPPAPPTARNPALPETIPRRLRPTPCPAGFGLNERGVHPTPSGDVRAVPPPTAAMSDGPLAAAKRLAVTPVRRCVQPAPSGDVSTVPVFPTTTNWLPVCVIPFNSADALDGTVAGTHAMPSTECKTMRLLPTATKTPPPNATPVRLAVVPEARVDHVTPSVDDMISPSVPSAT